MYWTRNENEGWEYTVLVFSCSTTWHRDSNKIQIIYFFWEGGERFTIRFFQSICLIQFNLERYEWPNTAWKKYLAGVFCQPTCKPREPETVGNLNLPRKSGKHIFYMPLQLNSMCGIIWSITSRRCLLDSRGYTWVHLMIPTCKIQWKRD